MHKYAQHGGLIGSRRLCQVSLAYSPVESYTPTTRFYSILITSVAVPDPKACHATDCAYLLWPQTVQHWRREAVAAMPEGVRRPVRAFCLTAVAARSRVGTRETMIILAAQSRVCRCVAWPSHLPKSCPGRRLW